MRQQYWGFCISKMLQGYSISSQIDCMNLNKFIKELLMGVHVPSLESYQLWDGNNKKDYIQKDQILSKIVMFHGQLSLYIHQIDFLSFSNNIQNINYCFSIITLFPQKNDLILQIYEKILTGTFLDTLQLALSMMLPYNILVQALKSLCYLYQAMKIQKIRKILEQSFLVSQVTLKALIQSVKDTRAQVRYYTCVMMSLMINNIRNIPNMKSFALVMLNDLTLLKQISNCIAKIQQQQGLSYSIQFLIGIIKSFPELPQPQKTQTTQILDVYLNFVINKLSQLKQPANQAICIKLVVQCVKVTDFSQDNIKLLKFMNSLFQVQVSSKQEFMQLFGITLDIIKYSLIYNRTKIQQHIISDKSFQNYLKKVLHPNHQLWQPFYSILQIILIIVQSKNTDILYKQDLIPCIFELVQSKSGLVLLYVSQILVQLIANSMESQWKVSYLYEKGCFNVISGLFNGYCIPDQILQNQYKTSTYNKINSSCRRILINALKSLYLLTNSGSLSQIKRKQHYIKNFSYGFINSIYNAITYLFKVYGQEGNVQYLGFLLKEQYQIDRNYNIVGLGGIGNNGNQNHRGQWPAQNPTKSIKLYKIIHMTIQQMTYNLRKRNTDIQTLKQVNKTRTQFLTNLYKLFPYTQLSIENIPIYLSYSTKIDGNTIKQKLYKLTWNQYRTFLLGIIKQIVQKQVEEFRIIDQYTRNQIDNQETYRKYVNMILMDYYRYGFCVDVEIVDVKERVREDVLHEQNYRDVPMFMGNTGSMRVNDYDGRNYAPRFMSYKMPQSRDNSPYSYGSNQRLNQGSPKRNQSPNFRFPCLQCNRPTLNSSKICNACVNNY